ncbi:MAG: hypothetical protein H7067_12695 [Burkholderiales bacterium]|nr:hypothetical protein [Opitutaceae bacterium]
MLIWVLGGVLLCAASVLLAWMLLLPGAVQSRLSAATGAQFSVQGLMGDPFAGRATATGWTLRASPALDSPLLARGGATEIVASDWRAALAGENAGSIVIDRLDLVISEAVLAPDKKGSWRLLALAAGAGLPYERDGKIGEGPRLRIAHLRLSVETLIVRDAKTGRDTPVHIAWRGEFRELEHTRPVVAALLAAARGEAPAP